MDEAARDEDGVAGKRSLTAKAHPRRGVVGALLHRRDAVAEVVAYNRRFVGQRPADVKAKFRRMAADAFSFFRGTFHLYAQDVVGGMLDPMRAGRSFAGVVVAIVGDLHMENFGTYRAVDGDIVFDVNDFDETSTGGFDFDVKRCATSLFLAAQAAGLGMRAETAIAAGFVEAYVDQISYFARRRHATGWVVDRGDCAGAMKRALAWAGREDEARFLERLTRVAADGSRAFVRDDHHYQCEPHERTGVEGAIDGIAWRGGRKPRGRTLVHDVVNRVAGVGSMGGRRYAVLCERSRQFEILELKQAFPSAYDNARGRRTRGDRAAQVVAAQRKMQGKSPARSGTVMIGDISYQVRALEACDVRLDATLLDRPKRWKRFADLLGRVTARCHAKSERAKSAETHAIAAALAGREDDFAQRVVAFAHGYAGVVYDDWQAFSARAEAAWRQVSDS